MPIDSTLPIYGGAVEVERGRLNVGTGVKEKFTGHEFSTAIAPIKILTPPAASSKLRKCICEVRFLIDGFVNVVL